ncbi:phenylacetate--CoA ligase family protein [Ramlibacter tataouinensis]|uniref:Phenylacetate-coenzyme A ligase (Phenylacetyl-CoA ligase)-like protein n=1 Tax=Ramlibacter tataouinensis (strain ATCC BAA-407 / DSM 14655 / LMG 21543 / TTB310) TaxID=365046 RepID=F5Y063_RAMTT|nr:AMP-binding protein [Ramlibacter tataouinensis]AEG94612.1 phenylacetate-coenzyme A ligase (Phenylacetyl-CoA ligase)-like protein [Ramlibacter tataouinensis TTB310]
MSSSKHYDALETRSPAEREAQLMAALPRQVAHAQRHAPAMAQILAGVDAAAVDSRQALARLPVTRKHELLERQKAGRAADPFGGFAAQVRGPAMLRIFASPGPIYEPDGAARDYWRTARAMHAAGFCAGDLVHNAFSYHMTPGAFIMEAGAHALGCTVFPAGTGQTEQQLQAIAELRPRAYAGTPSFLRILLEKAAETGADAGSLRVALTGGEALPPSLRDWFAERGLQVFQSYATADLGLIAYETEARQGLVLDEGVIVEIVRPGTGEPVPEGEVGEVVVTTLNPDYPLIRFGTGDLSAVLPGACPSGRTNIRIRGWLGRADQTTKIRGMFVHPAQVADIARRFPEVLKARLVVSGEMANDTMTLKVEAVGPQPVLQGLQARLGEAIRDVTKLRGEVLLLQPGSLPNDGKVIEDARSYK